MDLSSLSAIEGAESVTLKWFLPDFESTGTTASQLRIDDLQITATLNANPGPLTNTSVINITKTSNNQPDGYTYPIAIEVPSGIGSPMPVAILLHGRGGNGNGAINQFRNTLDNHILVAPTGYQNSWNITDEPSDLPDIAFLRDLLTEIKTFSNVDSTRIRVVGTSNGSGMTNRVFVEIDDPGIDIICPIVSQMHQGNYRNGLFYAPSNEQNTAGLLEQAKDTILLKFHPKEENSCYHKYQRCKHSVRGWIQVWIRFHSFSTLGLCNGEKSGVYRISAF